MKVCLSISAEALAQFPSFLQAYFAMAKPPVKIAKIAIGDGSIASDEVFELLPAVSSPAIILQTTPGSQL